ncbi:transposase, partial [Streptomyces vinaceus]
MIGETRSWGVDVPLVLADAGYGDAVAFRLGLNQRGPHYVVGISTTPTAHRAAGGPVTPPCSGIGRRPAARYPDPARGVKALVNAPAELVLTHFQCRATERHQIRDDERSWLTNSAKTSGSTRPPMSRSTPSPSTSTASPSTPPRPA